MTPLVLVTPRELDRAFGEMDPEAQCTRCQTVVEAMSNWSQGLMSDAFEVPLGTFAGFEVREDCKACQFVVQHFKTDPLCHPLNPSCHLILSRNVLSKRFWIFPVSFAKNSLFRTFRDSILGCALWEETRGRAPVRAPRLS
jgi:hypothetical protein